MVQEESHHEALAILGMNVVDATQVWLSLPGFPFPLHPSEVLGDVDVEECFSERICLVQLKKRSQFCCPRLSHQIDQVVPLWIEYDSLAVWQMNIQSSYWGRAFVNGETEKPPICLIRADILTELVTANFAQDVGVVHTVHGGVAPLAEVFGDVLHDFNGGAHLHIDVGVEQTAEHRIVGNNVRIGDQDLVVAVLPDKVIASI